MPRLASALGARAGAFRANADHMAERLAVVRTLEARGRENPASYSGIKGTIPPIGVARG